MQHFSLHWPIFMLKTSLFLRIFCPFSENALFCVEKSNFLALYFQGVMKNVIKK